LTLLGSYFGYFHCLLLGDHINMQGFYKIMGKLVTHRPFVNMLCKTKDYEQVVSVLREVAASE